MGRREEARGEKWAEGACGPEPSRPRRRRGVTDGLAREGRDGLEALPAGPSDSKRLWQSLGLWGWLGLESPLQGPDRLSPASKGRPRS